MRWPNPSDGWELWFAWYPVDCGTHRVWLEYVERKFPQGNRYMVPSHRLRHSLTVKQK